MLSITLYDGARPNAAQLATIMGAYIDAGISCDVRPDGECLNVVPADEEAWMGHTMDIEGDYIFPTVAVGPNGITNEPQITKCHWSKV